MKRTLIVVVLGVACVPAEPRALHPNTFAFAVFGDGPYRRPEQGAFERLIDDVNRTEVEWFLHVGDILSGGCSNEKLDAMLQQLNTIRHPVIYTPGDNEWTDCRGRYRPLERLERIRETYFKDPTRSIAGAAMAVESQSANPAWKEFVENVRWRRGGFLFVTTHIVGSFNGTRRFEGRSAADDSAVVRRTAAALAWIDSAFAIAERDSLSGVVIALHANPRFHRRDSTAFRSFVTRVAEHTAEFRGEVLAIHGDTHEYTVDHPLARLGTTVPLANFTRLETFGSPDIGWVRVVVDSVAGKFVEFEARRIR
ncbi:MAG TPA: metallophosphoesterase [Gemmatimonadaceae bacterium]|nr:metallophosphoesterase [Gemmatimonadaceae bacterium]